MSGFSSAAATTTLEKKQEEEEEVVESTSGQHIKVKGAENEIEEVDNEVTENVASMFQLGLILGMIIDR